MTKCGAFWKKALQFKKNDDFDGFCEWCGSDRDHLREDWKIVELINTMQICMDDINKLPSDALRPLLRKQNEVLIPQTLKKIESYIKGGHQLTRKKTEEFMYGKNHVGPQPKLTRCGFPECQKGAYRPAIIEGVPVCPDHNEAIQKDPSLIKELLAKPSVPERTLKKTYSPFKPTREEREALMHPKESKMDWEMFELLKNDPKVKEHGYKVEFQKEYILLTTISDVTLVKDDDEIAVYWDHVKTHKNRGNRDAYLRGLLEKRHHGTRALGFDYKDNTKKSVEELLRQVHGELR